MVALIDYSKRGAAKETTNDNNTPGANESRLNIKDDNHHDDNHLVCQPHTCSHPHHKERSESTERQIQAAQKAAASELPDKPKTQAVPFSAFHKKNRMASIHPASLPSARKASLTPNSFNFKPFKRCETSELVREHRNRRPTILAEMSFADGMDSSLCDVARARNTVERPSVVMGKDWSLPSKKTAPKKKLVLSRPSAIGRSVSDTDAMVGDLSMHSITETNDDEEPKERKSLGNMKESDRLSFTLRRPHGKSKEMDDSISSACRLEQSLSNLDHNSSFTGCALDMGLSASMSCHASTGHGMYSQFRGRASSLTPTRRRESSLSSRGGDDANTRLQHAHSYSPTRTTPATNSRSNTRRTSSMSPKRPQQIRRAASMSHQSSYAHGSTRSSSPTTTRRSKKRTSKSPKRRSRSTSLQGGHSSLQLLSMDPQTLRQAKEHHDDAIPHKITLDLEKSSSFASSTTTSKKKSATFLQRELSKSPTSSTQQPLLPLDLDHDEEEPPAPVTQRNNTSSSLRTLSREELGYGTLAPMVDGDRANKMCSTQALPGYETDGDSIASEEMEEDNDDDQSFAAEHEAPPRPAIVSRSRSHQAGSSSKSNSSSTKRKTPRRSSSFQGDSNQPSANNSLQKQLPRRCASFQPPQAAHLQRNTARSRSPVPSPAQIYGLGQHSHHNQHHLSPFHKQHSQQRRRASVGNDNKSSAGLTRTHSLLMDSSSSSHFARTDSNASLASTGFVTGSRIRRIESNKSPKGKRPTRKQSVLG